jgi:hypothetical protein
MLSAASCSARLLHGGHAWPLDPTAREPFFMATKSRRRRRMLICPSMAGSPIEAE